MHVTCNLIFTVVLVHAYRYKIFSTQWNTTRINFKKFVGKNISTFTIKSLIQKNHTKNEVYAFNFAIFTYFMF